MAAKDSSPCNQDLLQSAKFILSFPRLTAVQFFCQAANVPGLLCNPAIQATPFSDLPIAGDKLVYGTLDVEFLLDEELQTWISIHDWMRGLSFPAEFEEYKNLKHLSRYSEQVKYPQYADAELISLSASGQPLVKFHFIELFPISLSRIEYDIRIGSEKTMTATSSFKFKRYNIIKV
jgi:hypothetical protein